MIPTDLPQEVQSALKDALDWAHEHADTSIYADAAYAYITAFEQNRNFGIKEIADQTQILYILGNLSSWKGEKARAAKKVLKEFIS